MKRILPALLCENLSNHKNDDQRLSAPSMKLLLALFLGLFCFTDSQNIVYHISPEAAFVTNSLEFGSSLREGDAALKHLITTYTIILKKENLTHDTAKLLEGVLRAAVMHYLTINDLKEKLDVQYEQDGIVRKKRSSDSVHPLYGIGSFLDWAVGLTSNERFHDFSEQLSKTDGAIHMNLKDTNEAVESNAIAISDYIVAVNKLGIGINKIVESNNEILENNKMMINILNMKFEMEAMLKELIRQLLVLAEVFDRADIGLASKFIVEPSSLESILREISSRLPGGLKPLWKQHELNMYYQLPLSMSHKNLTTLSTILKVPVSDSKSLFSLTWKSIRENLVYFQGTEFSTLLTFPQFKECQRNKLRSKQAVCFLRPCLEKNINIDHVNFICFALNSTDFVLIQKSEAYIKDELRNIQFIIQCGTERPRLEQLRINHIGYHLKVPLNCQIQTSTMIIKQVHTHIGLPQELKPSINQLILDEKNEIRVMNHGIKRKGEIISSSTLTSIVSKRKAESNNQDHSTLSLTALSTALLLVILLAVVIYLFKSRVSKKDDIKDKMSSKIKGNLIINQTLPTAPEMSDPLSTKDCSDKMNCPP